VSASFFGAWTIERGSETYEIEFEYSVGSWGCAAQTYGPPENCYPAEGMEIELGEAWMAAPAWAIGKYLHDVIPFALTDAERWRIQEWLCENPPEADYPEWDD
jgi:hypothetical protein